VLSLIVSRFGLGRTSIAAGHKVKGDHNAKERLKPTLAPDEVRHRTFVLLVDMLKPGLCIARPGCAPMLLLQYTYYFCVLLYGYVQHVLQVRLS
jgi:hypothetical protein